MQGESICFRKYPGLQTHPSVQGCSLEQSKNTAIEMHSSGGQACLQFVNTSFSPGQLGSEKRFKSYLLGHTMTFFFE